MYTVGAISALFALSLTGFLFYGPVVDRKALQNINVSEAGTHEHPVVTVDGRLIGGMMAVRKAEQMRTGPCVILQVRAGITRPGLRDATFHYAIQVPNDVDKISFESAENIIWTRKQ